MLKNYTLCRSLNEKMNTDEMFRCLVTNQFIPDFNYTQIKLSFQTVFYQSTSTYCCCECGFVNEFLDYMTTAGIRNKGIYNNILQSIKDGKCPHVDAADPKYIRETSVNGIHLAAVVGTEESIKDYLNNYTETYSALFQLTPYRLAILKENTETITLFQKYISNFAYWQKFLFVNPSFIIDHAGGSLVSAWKTKTHKYAVKIVETSEPEFCVEKRNAKLLKAMLIPRHRYSNINKAFDLAFEYNLNDMQDDLIEYIRGISGMDQTEGVFECAVSAILYNQPEKLHLITDAVKRILSEKNKERLAVISTVLDRTKCTEILSRTFEFHSSNTISLEDILSLICEHNHSHHTELNTIIQAAFNIQESINIPDSIGRTPLHVCIGHQRPLNPTEVKVLLELGADIDHLDNEGNTTVLHMLSRRFYSKRLFKRYYTTNFRRVLNLLLYENPSKVRNSDAVKLAIELDEHLEKSTTFRKPLGEFIMDGKEHSFFGLDHKEAYALNFMGPLLIECGFPVSRVVLEEALERCLHNAEHTFLRHCLFTTQSLQNVCRDVLRNHFAGRKIHMIVNSWDLPKKIKEFILLENELSHV